MELLELENLIKAIPVRKQASIVNKKSWEKKLKGQAANKKLFKEIYKGEITREDILKENNPKKKIMMTLMWGYPTGGRGNNISNILKKIEKLSTILSKDAELTEERFNQLLKKFRENEIKGLGPSTWSKLLYFFNYSIEGNKCLIYDQKIVSSLNRKQFSELANDEKKYKQNKNDYLIYLRKIKEWAEKIDAKDSDLPDKIEVFLFYFNLYYKWD
ncbi:MAG: hypothetical protein J5710_15550 [Treponema sp.]|nr:hypothetical protein [Treponema sp.]